MAPLPKDALDLSIQDVSDTGWDELVEMMTKEELDGTVYAQTVQPCIGCGASGGCCEASSCSACGQSGC